MFHVEVSSVYNYATGVHIGLLYTCIKAFLPLFVRLLVAYTHDRPDADKLEGMANYCGMSHLPKHIWYPKPAKFSIASFPYVYGEYRLTIRENW